MQHFFLFLLLSSAPFSVFADILKPQKNRSSQKEPATFYLTPSLPVYTAGVYQTESLFNFKGFQESENYLKYELVESSKEMRIENRVFFSWIPKKSDEGKSFPVTIRAIDEVVGKESILKFNVKVAKTEPLSFTGKNSIVDIKGQNCKSPSGKGIDYRLLFLKKEFHTYAPSYSKYFESDYINIDNLKLRKIISTRNYEVPPNIESLSCFFVMGDIKFPTSKPFHYRVLKNDFWVYPADKTSNGKKLILYRWTPLTSGPTDLHSYIPPYKSGWTYVGSSRQANGLYFIGRKIKK